MIVIGIFVVCFLVFIFNENKKVYKALANYTPVEKTDLNDKEVGLLALINNHRIKLGLNELIAEELACEVCFIAIENGVTTHYGWENRLIDCRAKSGGEIICYGMNNPMSAFSAYIKSDKHRKAIENKERTHIGLAYVGSLNICILTNY